MTRKHFEMIAGILNNYAGFEGYKVNQAELVEAIAKEMAMAFESENPRFDPVRFFKACTK